MVSNILVKLIGAVYRIPMYGMLGDGMAYFNAAYNFYVTIYLISTTGIPVAISRMVAASEEKGSGKESRRILGVAVPAFAAVGFIAMSIMLIFARRYAAKIDIAESYLSMYAIAPTLFFICISSTFRGYYQGKKDMTLSAIVQVIEAFSKLCVGLLMVWFFLPRVALHVTAAYAILGVTVGVVVSFVFAIAYHMIRRRGETIPESPSETLRSRRSILRELIIICIPISVSSCITGLTSFVDNNLIVTTLTRVGTMHETALSLFSAYTSVVVPLFNMPPTLIYPIAISLLPNLAGAYAAGDTVKARASIDSALRVGALISLPCAFGMACVPEGIIRSLFRENEIVGTSLTTSSAASGALSIISVSIFFLAMISITNSTLQAWHKEYMPIVSSACGVAVKYISEYLLIRAGAGIAGAAASTLLCHLTILTLNTVFSVKYTGYFPNILKIFAKPFVSAAACGASALLTYRILDKVTSASLSGTWQARICLVAAVAVAAVVYVVLLAVLKAFNEEDIMMLPKGEKLCRVLRKIKAMD